jgi:glycosyltransferase involved in cell wall biosynthesis
VSERPLRVIYSFPHAVGRSGIGTTAYNQIRGAVDQGIEVELYCTSLERELPGLHRLVETLRMGRFRIPHRLLGVERAYRYHDRRVARGLAGPGKRVDLVHCWPSGCLATMKAARRLAIPTAREVPNTHTGYAFEVTARESELLGLAPVQGHSHTFDEGVLAREQREYELADLLLVPSAFSLRTFRERGIPTEKLALHRYGFDPDSFFANGITAPAGGLRAVFVGACEPRKGLHYALRAWIDSGAAATGTFTICGSFVPGYRERLDDLLSQTSIQIVGFVDDPGELMRRNDILLFPTLEEGSALVTYEAQASGCALLVSDAAGARCEHLREGLIHTAGDLEALTEHLRLIDGDRDLLLRLREGAVANSDTLTWRHAAAELKMVYAGLADRPA